MHLTGSRLLLVGPGRAGSALARSWTAAGGTLTAVVARTRAAAEDAAARLGAGTARAMHETAEVEGDVLAIAVPDDRIAEVAAALAGRVAAPFAFHLSGALVAEELAPLRRSGAAIGSLHPLSVFTGAASETWSGVLVAVEGEPAAVARGVTVAQTLGARTHALSGAGKPLYHAGAALAAGGTAALLSLAARLWERAGLREEDARAALGELAASAARAVRDRPFAVAFTGPIARRDLVTIRMHAGALEGTEAADVYSALAEEVLRRTPGLGREAEVRASLPPGSGKTPSARPESA